MQWLSIPNTRLDIKEDGKGFEPKNGTLDNNSLKLHIRLNISSRGFTTYIAHFSIQWNTTFIPYSPSLSRISLKPIFSFDEPIYEQE